MVNSCRPIFCCHCLILPGPQYGVERRKLNEGKHRHSKSVDSCKNVSDKNSSEYLAKTVQLKNLHVSVHINCAQDFHDHTMQVKVRLLNNIKILHSGYSHRY